MGTELTLPEIKSTAFQTLLHFRKFCEEQGIRFLLSNGTLLGAVKYGGFIPWDDDVDVFVPREDYNRLLERYQDSESYRLFSPERNPRYRYTFAKLCNMATVKEEDNIDNGVVLGVDIDIFPLDSCTEHILKPGVQRRLRLLQMGCVLAKFRSGGGRSLPKRLGIGVCRGLGYDWFARRLTKQIRREGSRGATHAGCLMWPIYGVREVLPMEIFSHTVEVTFEGEKFPAPVGYDAYLRSLYGNYEEDPPVEKQKSHHSYRAYRKS